MTTSSRRAWIRHHVLRFSWLTLVMVPVIAAGLFVTSAHWTPAVNAVLSGINILLIPAGLVFLPLARRRHARMVCDLCLATLPGSVMAEQRDLRLRQWHRLVREVGLRLGRRRVTLPVRWSHLAAAAGDATVLTALVATAGSWIEMARRVGGWDTLATIVAATAFAYMPLAAVTIATRALNELHEQLRPWCPYCRRPGDDDDDTPDPDPGPGLARSHRRPTHPGAPLTPTTT